MELGSSAQLKVCLLIIGDATYSFLAGEWSHFKRQKISSSKLWFFGVFLFKLKSICIRHPSAQFPKTDQACVIVTKAHRGVDWIPMLFLYPVYRFKYLLISSAFLKVCLPMNCAESLATVVPSSVTAQTLLFPVRFKCCCSCTFSGFPFKAVSASSYHISSWPLSCFPHSVCMYTFFFFFFEKVDEKHNL